MRYIGNTVPFGTHPIRTHGQDCGAEMLVVNCHLSLLVLKHKTSENPGKVNHKNTLSEQNTKNIRAYYFTPDYESLYIFQEYIVIFDKHSDFVMVWW